MDPWITLSAFTVRNECCGPGAFDSSSRSLTESLEFKVRLKRENKTTVSKNTCCWVIEMVRRILLLHGNFSGLFGAACRVESGARAL